MITDLIAKTRTCRRFDANKPISDELLTQLIDLARLGGSARNIQPWKYMFANTVKQCMAVFPYLGWAGYLPQWPGPTENERPTAYIFCLLDTNLADSGDFDLGISSQNILLGAQEHGISGCRIASLSPALSDLLNLQDNLTLKLVIALGYPAEDVTIVPPGENGDIKYWHGEGKSHFVPKRSLQEVLLPLSLKI